jgi:hypothetical protein
MADTKFPTKLYIRRDDDVEGHYFMAFKKLDCEAVDEDGTEIATYTFKKSATYAVKLEEQ